VGYDDGNPEFITYREGPVVCSRTDASVISIVVPGSSSDRPFWRYSGFRQDSSFQADATSSSGAPVAAFTCASIARVGYLARHRRLTGKNYLHAS